MRTWPLIVSSLLILSLIFIGATYSNCSSDPIPLDAESVTFSNVTYQAGLQDVGGQFLAWGDYNNDDFQDLLVNGNRLFQNNGPPHWDFSDVSSQAGISGGSYGTWADWNNDGYLDFYCAGSDKLYKNNGPPTWDFDDVTTQSEILKESHSTGAGWGDYDNDGDVDLFKIRGEDGSTGEYFPNSFWRNNGDGTFTNVTVAAGVNEYSDPKYSRGVAWADYNNDGWLDIYISNYRQLPNYLYENNGDGTFTDVAAEKGVADGPPRTTGNLDPYDRAGHGVGSVWGDYDNDGYLDLWVTNLNHKDARTSDDSLLYHNDGPPGYTFTNMRGSSGIPIKPYVFPNEGDELFVGCAWGDYDNDGDLDLFLPQIYDIDYAYSFLYSNNGDGTFTDVTVEAGVRVWDTYAGCWCDYDNDGDLDLITSGRDSGGNADPHFVHLFRNMGSPGNWIQLKLKGDGVNSNSAAIGSRVTLTTDEGFSQIKEVEGGMGPHGMQNSLALEFGLDDYSGTVDIEIRWPDGNVQFIEDLDINQSVNITESRGDFAITDVTFDDPNPITGEEIRISATVKNVGSITINTGEVKFYLDSVEDELQIPPTRTLYDVDPDEERTTYVDWDTSGLSGAHNIYVRAEIMDPSPGGPPCITLRNVFIRLENALPIANLSAHPTTIEKGESVFFDASNSTDDTYITAYYFDFGDGTNSGWISEESIDHEYHQGGDYTAWLKVRDEDGGESENLQEVVIEVRVKPTAHLTADPTTLYVGENVTFDGSLSSDEGGNIEEYNFDFGNGESSNWISESTITHAYSSAGEYNASLRVKDDDDDVSENMARVTINVKAIPYAVLQATPTSIYKDETVTFDASSSMDDGGSIESYYFDFGDGSKSGWISQSIITHTYSEIGVYSARLRVVDDDGDISTNTAEVEITVSETPNQIPTAIIESIEPYTVLAGNPVTFTGAGEDEDGEITAYQWRSDLDGELSTLQTFSTSSLSVGTHIIYFSVQDDDLAWSQEVSDILVVKAENEIPIVEISFPSDNERVSGIIVITGSAYDPDGIVSKVEINIDDGRWETVNGTYIWSHELDTTMLSDGEHIISVRAYDGYDYSDEELISIKIGVDGGKDEGLALNPLLIIGVVLIVVVVVIVLALAVSLSSKRKKGPRPQSQAQSPSESPQTRWNW